MRSTAFCAPFITPLRRPALCTGISICKAVYQRASITAVLSRGPLPDGDIRRGKASDVPSIAGLVFREGMNPLVGDPSNFVVFQDGKGSVIGCGQVRGSELASLVVRKDFRGQGVGRKIVKALLDRWDRRSDLFLLCLTNRMDYYAQFGFVACDSKLLPRGMQIERWLGDIVASVVEPGQQCVGMVLRKNSVAME